MRKFCALNFVLALILGLAGSPARAQFKNGSQATELNLPRLSQRATVIQRVGLTDITIVYHAPLAGGRELFGKVVPYGNVWRAGANENTTISFTDDVSVEGHPLPAGTYGLHMIPNADQWTIIFSKNSTSWGSFSYDEKEDALRVTVKPAAAENRDTLAYTFDDMKPGFHRRHSPLGQSRRPLPHFRGHQRHRRPQHRQPVAQRRRIYLGGLRRGRQLEPGQQLQTRRSAEVGRHFHPE